MTVLISEDTHFQITQQEPTNKHYPTNRLCRSMLQKIRPNFTMCFDYVIQTSSFICSQVSQTRIINFLMC